VATHGARRSPGAAAATAPRRIVVVVVGLGLAGVLASGCDGPLVSTPASHASQRDELDGARLAAQLRTLPGVASASVVVRRPAPDPLAPSSSASSVPPASAGILVVGPEAAQAPARALAQAALPELTPAAIALVVVPAPGATAEVAKVGPFWVARRSRAALVGALVGALGIIAGLALTLAARERRRAAAG
jgi:type III secretory pathway lipoprotein EscJ